MKQAKEFNVKNVIISDYENYNKIKNDKNTKIKMFLKIFHLLENI